MCSVAEHIRRTKTHNRGLCVVVGPSERQLKALDPASITRFVKGITESLAAW